MNVTPEDRRALDALLAEINNPATNRERRGELRDEYESIASTYIAADIYDGTDDDPSREIPGVAGLGHSAMEKGG